VTFSTEGGSIYLDHLIVFKCQTWYSEIIVVLACSTLYPSWYQAIRYTFHSGREWHKKCFIVANFFLRKDSQFHFSKFQCCVIFACKNLQTSAPSGQKNIILVFKFVKKKESFSLSNISLLHILQSNSLLFHLFLITCTSLGWF
jgi:hypothetical protein